jgi:SAM-dependent methyltransferase
MDDRHGAKQPERFDPARAARLDDPARFEYLPPADVLELLDAPHGAEVVDFGTGTGTYALAIARLRPDLHLIALDEQPEMLALLRAKLAAGDVANVKPVGNDVLPELRGRVARLLAINVLHEVGDDALAEIHEVLAGDGLATFIDWSSEVERPVGPPRDHVYTTNEARTRLEGAGFHIQDERRFPYHYALVARRT